MECLEIGRLIVRGALLPTPIQDADPFEGERPHGGLMGFPLLALLLVIDLCPEGMPDRFGGPLHERLAQKLGALGTPVDPGLLAAAFGDGRDPGILLQSGGGRIPLALFPEGD
jgi:hypothetical protein